VTAERDLARFPALVIWQVTPTRDLPSDLVAQVRDLDPGLLVLTGDDPFARPDLFALVEQAVESGLPLALAPGSPPSLTRVAIRRLAALGVARIALGLDGPDPTVHDRVRGTPGSFAATRRVIGDVHDATLGLELTTRLGCATVAELPRTADLVAEIAPALWNVSFVIPAARGQSDRPLGPHACERVFEFLYEWSIRTGVAAETTAAPAYRRVLVQRDARRRAGAPPHPRPLPVNDGKGLVLVSHTGDVYPSGQLPLTTANVREVRLAEIYRRSRLFRALRDASRLEGRCGVCPFRALCGGSRARAYAASGSFLAEDPGCAYRPAPLPAEQLIENRPVG
jgi:radical SAM protein with 4Fe4S-binding SPASM domain